MLRGDGEDKFVSRDQLVVSAEDADISEEVGAAKEETTEER